MCSITGKRFLRVCLLLGSVVPALWSTAANGQSQEAVADLDKYCIDTYGPGYFHTIDQRHDGFLCSVRTTNDYALLHEKFDPKDACLAQQGSTSFRRVGNSIFCLAKGSEPAEQTVSTVDLEAHCKKAYGEKVELRRNRVTGAQMCMERYANDLGMMYHPIETASLCPAGQKPGAVREGKLECVDGGGSGPATPAQQVATKDVGQVPASPKVPRNSVKANEVSANDGSQGSGYNQEQNTSGDRDIWVVEAPTSPDDSVNYAMQWKFLLFKLEKNGNELNLYYHGHSFKKNDLLDYNHYTYTLFGIKPGALVFKLYINSDRITGKTRLLIIGSRDFDFRIPIPNHPNINSECRTIWDTIDRNSSKWISVDGIINFDAGNVNQIQITSNIATLKQILPVTKGATQVSCEFADAKSWKSVYLNAVFRPLSPQPEVVNIKIVQAEAPFEEIKTARHGQKLRLKVLVDRDAEGYEVEAVINATGGSRLALMATCGSELDENPRVCLTRKFDVVSPSRQ